MLYYITYIIIYYNVLYCTALYYTNKYFKYWFLPHLSPLTDGTTGP